jgi:hypothetical protein
LPTTEKRLSECRTLVPSVSSLALSPPNWRADSVYIYGKDIQAATERLFDRLATTAFKDRVYEFRDEMIHEMYDEAEVTVFYTVFTRNISYEKCCRFIFFV